MFSFRFRAIANLLTLKNGVSLSNVYQNPQSKSLVHLLNLKSMDFLIINFYRLLKNVVWFLIYHKPFSKVGTP